MDLRNAALEVSRRADVVSLDRAWAVEDTAIKRLIIVCSHLSTIYKKPTGQPLAAEEFLNLQLTEEKGFSISNPADVALLVFEVIAERNRVPNLWTIAGAAGIDAVIIDTVNKLFRGPSILAGSFADGVKATEYADAKKQLIANLEARGYF